MEVTVALDPARSVGGLLEPGQTVAVLASFEPFQLSATAIDVDGEVIPIPGSVAGDTDAATPNTTDIILRKVLVTAVQENADATLGSNDDEETNRLREAPDGALLVTLAVRPFDAERIVFTSEFGFLWLAIERETVPEVDDSVKDRGNIYLDDDEEEDILATIDDEEAEADTEADQSTADEEDTTEDSGNP